MRGDHPLDLFMNIVALVAFHATSEDHQVIPTNPSPTAPQTSL